MKKHLLLLSAVLIAVSNISRAQSTPVWSTDIAPILYNKCASCHHSGGIAPFSLITYNEATTQPISAAVTSKIMPPWPPDPDYQRLAHERLLSQKEIDKIANWANNGKPQGDPNLAPPIPTFPTTGDLPGTPDLITKIPHFTSTAGTSDVYQCFVVPSGLSVDKFITAFEAIPGNRPIVHHVLVYADTTSTHVCANLDAATPGPGYVSFGGVGTDNAILLGGWVPGTAPTTMPTGFGITLPKNADIVIQIHYPANTLGQIDSTEIHFFFSPTPVRNVRIDPILNHMGAAFCNLSPGGVLSIPANQTKTFTETSTVSSLIGDVSLIGIAPHMHLIGKNISVFGVKGPDTQKYIRINNWDFHWQGFYQFRKILKVPGGTTLYSKAFYDNTTGNPSNPSNPPITVNAGEATTDEMMLTFFVWAYYQNGDENIVIDPSTPVDLSVGDNLYKGQLLFEPMPNPATNELIVKCYLEKAGKANLDIVDMQGKTVKHLMVNENMESGYTALKYNVSDLPAGMYTLRLQAPERLLTQKLAIQH